LTKVVSLSSNPSHENVLSFLSTGSRQLPHKKLNVKSMSSPKNARLLEVLADAIDKNAPKPV
jgi:hypothetical protein